MQRVHLCSNPCQFLINDVAFAVTTTDVLFHLRKEELPLSGNQIDPSAKSSETGDGALANACRHLLQQRRQDYLTSILVMFVVLTP